MSQYFKETNRGGGCKIIKCIIDSLVAALFKIYFQDLSLSQDIQRQGHNG